MVTIGVDAHKQVHAAVALDDAGQALGHWRGPNSREGGRAARLGGRVGRATAVGHRRGVELRAGPGPAPGGRRRGGVRGQPPLDGPGAPERPPPGQDRCARRPSGGAAGPAREAATLPRVGADDETAVLELLVTERDGAVAEATRLRNQLHQLLLQVDPEYRAHRPALRTPAGVAALAQYTTPSPRPLDEPRARAVGAWRSGCGWRWPRPRTWPGRFGSAPGRTSPPDRRVWRQPPDGRGTRGHPRAGPPVPHRCPTRRLRRRRPTGGLQRRAGAPPPQPGRQPPPERHPAPDRHHPSPQALRRSDLSVLC